MRVVRSYYITKQVTKGRLVFFGHLKIMHTQELGIL